MIKHIKWLIPVAIAAVAAAVWYLVPQQEPATPVADDTVESSAPAATEPLVRHPLSGEQTPLSSEDGSDESMKSSLEQLFQSTDFARILIPTQIVNHIVATVDNLPRNRLAVTLRPIHATPGKFAVTGSEDDRILSPDNYARYAAVLHIVRLADAAAVANWYRGHYALFQAAYQNLGYPEGYFNDRLVQAIDDLLDTPELTDPIHLVQPKVFYEFADPALESRSAGQKTLMRMGPDNTRIIKAKLREFRASITQPSA